MIIDLHSHILPGVDDGAMSMEDAVEMALSGLLPDGKTQAALLRVYLAKEREGKK